MVKSFDFSIQHYGFCRWSISNSFRDLFNLSGGRDLDVLLFDVVILLNLISFFDMDLSFDLLAENLVESASG